MVDVFTKEKRSWIMSRIKGKWTKQEMLVHNWLKGNKIRHSMHPKIEGNPDIILKGSKTAIFIHGCFWHKCPKCNRYPKSNKKYWEPKLEKNKNRDRKNAARLKKSGWKVLVIWEHDLARNSMSELKRCFGK